MSGEDTSFARDPDASGHEVTLDVLSVTFFLFRFADNRYAIRADHVSQIGSALDPVRVPGAPASIRGLVHQRGRIFTLVDMTSLLDIDRTQEDARSRRLIVIGRDEPFACNVDEAIGLREVPENAIRDIDDDGSVTVAEFDDESSCYRVVDIERIRSAIGRHRGKL